jgi:hypothetical protein
MPQSSEWRASFSPLTCNEYLLPAIALAMRCGTGRRNVGQSSAAWRFHRDLTAELPTRQAPRGFRRVDRSHIFACFTPSMGRLSSITEQRTRRWVAARGRSSMLADIDRFCGQIAAAIHSSELQLYATLGLIAVLSALLFPPKDDPDQV